MSIFKAMESLVADLKNNLRAFADSHEKQRQNIKLETKEGLLKMYKDNVTKENVVELHGVLMKSWNEIDLLVLDSPKPVELNDSEKKWEIYPLTTMYLKWTMLANVEYEVRNWGIIGLEDCKYNQAFKDHIAYGNPQYGEKILLVKI
jgi:hypothetical protein